MTPEKIMLSGSPIEIADYQDHKMATFLISVLDEYDLNHRMIPKESGEQCHASIVGCPILAKMVCDEAGDPVDFAGHEMYIITDEDGNSQVRFNTHPIGSVVESWIEEREVSGYAGKKFCIMIKAKLWSARYPEYFTVLDKLWAANNVKSSWELTVQEAVQTVKGKVLKAFSFIGNTLLGSKVLGAVPGAGVYEYAQADPELELASALSRDLCAEYAHRKEETHLENEMMEQEQASVDTITTDASDDSTQIGSEIQTAESVPEMSEEIGPSAEPDEPNGPDSDPSIGPDIAMLTSDDLRRRVVDAYRTKFHSYGWIAFWFPENHEAWVEEENRASALDYVRVIYSVENDEVTIVGTEPVTLTVSVSGINEALATRDDAITQANDRINELSARVASLQPYKDAADQAEQARIEAETAQKRKEFKAKMLASQLFLEQELETSDALKSMIERLDEPALKAEIAERFMRKLERGAEISTETAQVTDQKPEEARVQVAEADIDNSAFMRIFLGKD